MRKGKGIDLEYIKVQPKFVTEIRNKMAAHGSTLEDKYLKRQSERRDSDSQEFDYDLENAQLEGDEEVVKEVKEKKFNVRNFKPVFQSKQQFKEQKASEKTTQSIENLDTDKSVQNNQDLLQQDQKYESITKSVIKKPLQMRKKLTILSFNVDDV